MDSPCKECTNRQVGCHSDCAEYLAYREILEEQKETKRLQNLKPYYKKPVPGNAYKNKWRKKIKEE